MAIVRHLLSDRFDVDAHEAWSAALSVQFGECDAAVVDLPNYARMFLTAADERSSEAAPPPTLIVVDDPQTAERLRHSVRVEVFVSPVDAAALGDALRRICATPDAEELGTPVVESIEEALLQWAGQRRTIAVEGRWRGDRGVLYVEDGEITDARAGLDVGHHALDRMLIWPVAERRFWRLTALESGTRTIFGDVETTLMDARHRAREIQQEIDDLGGLDSVWAFDWKQFQSLERELPFLVDQLLPWLEGTAPLWKKIFAPQHELAATIVIVRQLIARDVLRKVESSRADWVRAQVADVGRGILRGDASGEGGFSTPTLAEAQLPPAHEDASAGDFSDRGDEAPLAPLLEEKESMLAELDRLRAQLASLEAEQRVLRRDCARRDAASLERDAEADATSEDRATRLFWRQVAFERHARETIERLKRRSRHLDGVADDDIDEFVEIRHLLGDDSGLFAIAHEASAFAAELRASTESMRDGAGEGERPSGSSPRFRGRGGDPFADGDGLLERAERPTDEHSISEHLARTTRGDDDDHRVAAHHTPPSVQSAGGAVASSSGTSTWPGAVSATAVSTRSELDEDEGLRRPRETPRSLSRSSAPRNGETTISRASATAAFEELGDSRTSTSPLARPGSGSYTAARADIDSQEDFLTTEVPGPDFEPELGRAPIEFHAPSSDNRREGERAPRQTTLTSRPSESFRDPATEEPAAFADPDDLDSLFNEFSDSLFADGVDEALDRLFDDRLYDAAREEPFFEDFEGLDDGSPLEESGLGERSQISDIWLPPDALRERKNTGQFTTKGRRREYTNQLPIATVRRRLDEETSSERASAKHEADGDSPAARSSTREQQPARDERAENQRASGSSEDGGDNPSAPPVSSVREKDAAPSGSPKPVSANKTLLMSAISAPHDLRRQLDGLVSSGDADRDVIEDPEPRWDGFDSEFEEENTPVAGVERVRDAVLGNSGFRHHSAEHESIDANHESADSERESADAHGEMAAHGEMVAQPRAPQGSPPREPSSERRGRSVAASEAEVSPLFDETSGVSEPSGVDRASQERAARLRGYEPRFYVWALAALLLIVSILILVFADPGRTTDREDEAVDSEPAASAATSEKKPSEQAAEAGTGEEDPTLVPAPVVSGERQSPRSERTESSASRGLVPEDYFHGIAHGGETAHEVEQHARDVLESVAVPPSR